MASCALPYLDQYYTEDTPEVKTLLTKARGLHEQLSKSLKEQQDSKGAPLFTPSNGFMVLASPGTALRDEQDRFITSNTGVPPLLSVRNNIEVSKGVFKDVLQLDVRPRFLKQDEKPENLKELDPAQIRLFGTSQVKGEIQEEITSGFDPFIQSDKGIEQDASGFFQRTMDRILDSLSNYAKKLEEGKVDRPDSHVDSRKILREMYKLNVFRELKVELTSLAEKATLTPEEEARKVALEKELRDTSKITIALAKYIAQTTNWLDSIYQEVYKGKNSISNLKAKLAELTRIRESTGLTEEQQEEWQDTLNTLSKLINKTSHYIYLFDDLIRFKEELTEMGYDFDREAPIKRSEAFYEAFNKFLENNKTGFKFTEYSKELISNYFDNRKYNRDNFEELVRNRAHEDNGAITANDASRFAYELKELLDRFSSKSAESLLKESAEKLIELKSKIKQTHFDVIEEWLWPVIEQKQRGSTSRHVVTRDQFRTLLHTAKIDESALQHWFDATVQSSDPLVAATALRVGDAFYDAMLKSQLTGQEITDTLEGLKLGNMSKDQTEQFYQQFSHDTLIPKLNAYGNIQEAGADYEGPTIQVNLFGKTYTLQAETKRAYLSEWNEALYDAHHKTFYEKLNGEVRTLFEMLPRNDKGEIADLTQEFPEELFDFLWENKQSNPYYEAVFSKLFYKPRDGEYQLSKYLRYSPKYPNAIWNDIKGAMQSSFYQTHTQKLDADQFAQVLQESGLLDLDGAEVLPKKAFNYISGKSIGTNENREGIRKSLLKNPHVLRNDKGEILTRYRNEQDELVYGWMDPENMEQFATVQNFYYPGRAFTELNRDLYHRDGRTGGGFSQELHDNVARLEDPRNASLKNYFDLLYKEYQKANGQLGRDRLRYDIIPQIERLNNLTVKGMIPNLTWWDKLLKWLEESVVGEIFNALTGRTPDKGSYVLQDQYLNGDKARTIPVRYTQYLKEEEVERDLYRSTLMFITASNQHGSLKKIHPQVQILRNVINPNIMLGMGGRKAEMRDSFDRVIQKYNKKAYTEGADRLNKKLTEFLNDMVYGEAMIDSLPLLGKKVDMNRISKKLMGYTAFTTMSMNFVSAFSNLGVGNITAYSEAVGGKYFSKKDFWLALKEYLTNLSSGAFLKDLMEPNPANKSLLGQLAYRLDAIQGELLDEGGEVSRTGNTKKMLNRALYFTQNGAEHQIQITQMIAMLRGYKIEGKSLWDRIKYTKGELVEFEGVSDAQLREFQQKLHAMNKKLNGHYAKIDKAVLQRRWWGQLIMMFKKYIYSSIRYRWGESRFDYETGEEQEGYIRVYFNQLMQEIREQKSGLMAALFLGKNLLIRPTLSTLDQLSLGVVSRNNEAVSKFLYGEGDTVSAMKQTSFDLMMLSVLALIIMGVQAADDDDDEVLGRIEVLATQLEGDLGMYLPFHINVPFINSSRGFTAFTTYDKIMQMVKSPLAQLRTYNSSVNLLSQLLEDLGNREFEQYQRSGPGYEKGDYKAERALKRSILAPYYQWIRFLNPEEQLQFFNLARQNSK